MTAIVDSLLKYFRAILCGVLLSGSACADDSCTFNDNLISEKQYSGNSAIATFQVFSKNNEVKGVLSNGNLFSVKHWSCDHYGKQAVMIIGSQIKSITEELNSDVIQLGKLTLNEDELKLLINSLDNKRIELSDLPMVFRIQTKAYDEYYLKIDIVGEAIFIEIKLYNA